MIYLLDRVAASGNGIAVTADFVLVTDNTIVVAGNLVALAVDAVALTGVVIAWAARVQVIERIALFDGALVACLPMRPRS